MTIEQVEAWKRSDLGKKPVDYDGRGLTACKKCDRPFKSKFFGDIFCGLSGCILKNIDEIHPECPITPF